MKTAWVAIALALLVALPAVSVGSPATVPQIPTPPTNLTSCGSTPTSVCLRWTGGTGSPLINNTVYYGLSCASVTGVSTGLQGVSGSTFFYNLTGLHPSTSYCLWVTDWSQVGQSNPSSQLTVSTSTAPLGASGSPITRDLITIWNNASVATGTYQQLVIIDSARLSQQIDSNWSNVAFAYRNGTPIFAWIESNATTTSHSTYVWLKLYSIPATSSIVIEMDCYAWSVQKSSVNGPTGEAPYLSSIYGVFDDGKFVFSLYFNGTTPTSQFTEDAGIFVNHTITSYGSGTLPAISVMNSANQGAGNAAYFGSISLGASTNYIVEEQFKSDGTGLRIGVGGLGNAPGSSGGIGLSTQGGADYLELQNFNAGQVYSSCGSAVGSWRNGTLWVNGTSTGMYGFAGQTPYSTTCSVSAAQGQPAGTYRWEIPMSGNPGGRTMFYQWMRILSAPPHHVMPPYTLAYSLPDSPTAVSAFRTTTSTTLVRWSNPIVDPSAPSKNTLVNDTILYGSNPAILDHRVSVGVATSATIGNLTPGVREWFSVQAWNPNGASSLTDPVPDSGNPPPTSTTTTAASPSIPIFWWLVFGLAVFAILGSFVLVLAVARRDRDD